MFEGLVHQLLLGYLGRYFKDIQKQQLKIRLEEVLLENVELILEAFDYLQLPFALNQGRVGKLSIKIPWKKPWDPIIIILEDVFISASKRDDHEWNADAVERREFAGKKAKLAAAELGKLSRRVSGGLAGQSFISHVTAKILDSIQVDIRNFHVLYSDAQNDLVTSPYGNNIHHNENVTVGNFAFTTSESGNYIACFWVAQNHGGGDVSMNLDWKIGVAAKDWDSVARKEKIEGVELELRKLEGSVEAIHENLIRLKDREAGMRTVSESTNARVAWFSFMSLGICIAVSVLQLWHLKRYFQKKKLI